MTVAALGDVADFVNGFAFKPKDWHDDGLPIIRIQNLTDASKPINYTTRAVPEKYRVRRGDLLVSWSATLGVFTWDRTDEALVNQHIFRVVPSDKIDHGFLRHMLSGALTDMQRHLHGATMKHVNRGEFLATKIPHPPLPEQRRIASILGHADALRAKRRQVVAHLDTLIQSVFRDSFSDHSPHAPLSEFVSFYSGGTPPKSRQEYWAGGLPWFSAKDLKASNLWDSRDHIAEAVPIETRLRLLPADTIALVVRGMILAHTAPVSVLRVPSTINQDLKALLPRVEVDVDFLAAALRARAGWILARVSTAAHGTKKLESSVLEAIPIPHVHIERQRIFAARAKHVAAERDALQRAMAADEQLFASLQSRAFRGDL